MITIHGSVLTSPATARDIDVVFHYPHTREEAAAAARAYLAQHGLADRPVDAQLCAHVPALPFCPPPPFVVAGISAGVAPRVEWSLAAWVRACEISMRARLEYPLALGRTLCPDDVRPGWPAAGTGIVVVAVRRDAPDVSDGYHGGGPQSLRSAREKAPHGWAYCLDLLPEPARNLVVAVAAAPPAPAVPGWGVPLPPELPDGLPVGIVRHLSGSPASGWGEVGISTAGIYARYSGLMPWSEVVR